MDQVKINQTTAQALFQTNFMFIGADPFEVFRRGGEYAPEIDAGQVRAFIAATFAQGLCVESCRPVTQAVIEAYTAGDDFARELFIWCKARADEVYASRRIFPDRD